ncbi:hypothetical protein Syn7502_02549 [Synechococcus sp. PCC 7502]|uniref:PFE-CTERM domain-containing protein n=1 Tax=Synechococcus sp. PCC 7502 TaxID=1173263 RepID=UPI00029F9B12|nr:hypothetical protein [Synechococcus sp. PCC 7502]AFY74520.1 hypothetical protein Syn7502_02549 [Synechococcus sp. PCC 7502]
METLDFMVKLPLTASLIAIGTAIGVAIATSPVFAISIAAIDFTGDPNSSPSLDYLDGFQFTVGTSNIIVDQLGYYDARQDGLLVAHDVGIFLESNQQLVVSTTVPSGTETNLSGFFRYVGIKPTILFANTTYRVAGVSIANQDPFTYDPTGFSVNPAIIYKSAAYTPNTTVLAFPSSLDGGFIGYFGANFTISATTPVPFEFNPVLGLGILGGLFIAKKISGKLLKKGKN